MSALKKHSPAYHFLSVIIHFAVYLPFFVVQFLYNFDITGHANADALLKSATQIVTHGTNNSAGI
jgi:hypothetical protein